MKPINVLFVCLANICRSPTAQAVLRRQSMLQGVSHSINSSSAGTSDVRAFFPADKKAAKIASKKGYDLSRHTAREITEEIAAQSDYILVVDTYNLLELKEKLPVKEHGKIHLLLDYSERYPGMDIPDPYKRSTKAYQQALGLIEEAVEGFIHHVREKHHI